MKITDGVYKLDGVKGANSYLYESIGGEVSIIDTGLHGNERKIIAAAEKLGIAASRIKNILLTHADADHAGSAPALRKITGAKIAVHLMEVPFAEGKKKKKYNGILGFIFGFVTSFFTVPKFSPDVILGEGDMIGGLKAVHLPGHSEGSTGFYVPGKVLFTGDALVTGGDSKIKGVMEVFTPDVRQAKLSIKKMSDLAYDILLPGHGGPVIGGACGKIKEFAETYCR